MNRTLTLPRNCDHSGHGYIKEELELEPGNGSATTVTVSSAASMNNVNDAAEVLRQRQRFETCAFSKIVIEIPRFIHGFLDLKRKILSF